MNARFRTEQKTEHSFKIFEVVTFKDYLLNHMHARLNLVRRPPIHIQSEENVGGRLKFALLFARLCKKARNAHHEIPDKIKLQKICFNNYYLPYRLIEPD